MRQAGSIASSQDAQRLTAYLITQGIAAQVEQEGSQWAIWVREEDQVPKAREEIARYLADPQNPRYEGAEKAAAEQLREEANRREQVQKNIRSPVSNQWSNERVSWRGAADSSDHHAVRDGLFDDGFWQSPEIAS